MLQYLLSLLAFVSMLNFSAYRFSFSKEEMKTWSIINDGVMGGLSKSRAVATDDGALFFGTVSLENNGGFAFYRSQYRNYNLGEAEVVKIRYRSEGMAMGLQLDNFQRFYYPYFKINLPISPEWTELTVPLKEVQQYRMGYSTGRKLTEDELARIIRIGFISNEKRAGDFKLEIDYILFE